MALTQQQIDSSLQALGINPNAPLPSNPDILTALANYTSAADSLTKALNANLVANYNVVFTNWANQVLAGKIANTNPPLPPLGWVSATASDGWTYVLIGNDPVAAMPPIPSIPVVPTGMVVAIGKQIPLSSYFSSSVIDAAGKVTASANIPSGWSEVGTSADGVSGTFTFVASPFGGWWQKTA